MTKRDAERILRAWQRRLGLDHWAVTLEMDAELESETADAEVSWDWSYDNATLRLGDVWRGYEPRRAEAIIVHELLHLCTRDLEVSVAEGAQALPLRARKVFRDRYAHELEGVVDRLSVRLVEVGGLS